MALLLLMAAVGCAAQTLSERLDRLVIAAPLDRVHVGLEVIDLKSGDVVYAHNARAGFTPASNTKLFSGAFALATLGANYTFTTRVIATAKPNANGTLHGDVVIVGSGDPTMSARRYPFATCHVEGDGYAALHQFAKDIAARGVRRIEGDIVGDDTRYPYEPYAPDWTVEDASTEEGDAALNALMVDDNRPVTRVLARQAGLDPAWNAAEHLRLALYEVGINVIGTARARHREPNTPWVEPQGVELARRVSPPLSEILVAMEKCSINLHADSLALEAALKTKGELASFDAALKTRAEFLKELGVPMEMVELNDGSGLARTNLVTPHAVNALLVAAHNQRWGALFQSSLPTGGFDGTLTHRFRDDDAAKRIQAKTGTLRHVSALSGYAGSRYAFALFATEYFPADRRGVVDALDTIALEIAKD